MSKRGSDKLLDQEYRRTVACSKYSKVIRDRGAQIPSWNDERLDGRAFNLNYVTTRGVQLPLLFKDGRSTLNMRIIDPSSKLTDIAAIIGADTPIKV